MGYMRNFYDDEPRQGSQDCDKVPSTVLPLRADQWWDPCDGAWRDKYEHNPATHPQNTGAVKLDKVAVKLDKGKPKVASGVLGRFPRALEAVAEVSSLGVEKYGLDEDDNNYANVPDGFRRYTNALVRHVLAEMKGLRWNTERGGHLPPNGRKVLTAAQTAWNALARLEILLRQLEAEEGQKNEPDTV